MPKNSDSSKYYELPNSRACQRHHFKEMTPRRTFVDRLYYRVLIEAMFSDLYDPKQKQLKLLEGAWLASEISEANDFCES